ncbi:ATP-binding protein [Amycolatopsis sp. NPDC059021]|uniref:ATP-binding protein n=1 Tax=Amycolatopsis sp. NPDC059021 TaxID=3346704 RepID=UPI00366EDD7D
MTTSRLPSAGPVSTAAVSLRLPADVTAPAIARHAVRDVLTGLGVHGQSMDDVLLATSELVTNAFEHGEQPDRLELQCTGERLTLRVFDSGTEVPRLKEPSPKVARSRGLQLVHALAEDWGYERCPGGKIVWAVFLLPLHGP